MEIFRNFKKNLNSIALIDEKIGNFKYKDLINIKKHTLELSNWINNLKN